MIKIASNTLRDIDLLRKHHVSQLHNVVLKRLKFTEAPQRDFIKNNLETILGGSPLELDNMYRSYTSFCKEQHCTINAGLELVFDYKNFTRCKGYNIYALAKALDVKVCPYCNRMFTFTVVSGEKQLTRPEFDHFFSQKQFPLLALSFFNLVPSCVICNSRLKGGREFSISTYIHPYMEDFGIDLRFGYTPQTFAAALGFSNELTIELQINTVSPNFQKINNNVTVFRLKEIYQQHADIVREIINKYYISSGSYLQQLRSTFPLIIGSSQELHTIGYGYDADETNFEHRPLAKLSGDIIQYLEQLKV